MSSNNYRSLCICSVCVCVCCGIRGAGSVRIMTYIGGRTTSVGMLKSALAVILNGHGCHLRGVAVSEEWITFDWAEEACAINLHQAVGKAPKEDFRYLRWKTKIFRPCSMICCG